LAIFYKFYDNQELYFKNKNLNIRFSSIFNINNSNSDLKIKIGDEFDLNWILKKEIKE